MPSVVSAQTDFSAGEIDVTAKRDNKSSITQAGARQMENWRILNTKAVRNRSGRRALFSANDRVEEFLIAPGTTYYIAFPSGGLKIYDSTGTQVFSDSARPWNATTARQVVWALYDRSIYVTFDGMKPRILTWDGAVSWVAADFAEKVIGNQKRTLFYRIAPKGVTLTVSGLTGTVNITFSGAVLVSGMIGTRIRFNGKQMTIATVTGVTTGTAMVNETLPSNRQTVTTAGVSFTPTVGDVVSQPATGASGTVISVAAPAFVAELTTSARFAPSGTVFDGPSVVSVAVTSVADAAPAASTIWDQEVMNSYQGWPRSCFVDQNRLGFCDFPPIPQGVAWSTENDFTDFYPDAFAIDGLSTDAIFELVPGKRRVYYVIPGMDASEFVFTDSGLFYVPINTANPLKPGSVQFSTISEDECGQVQPRRAGEFIIYATGGLNQLMVVRIFGAYTRAYKTESITDLAAHLFSSVVAIAIMTASGSFAERYLFVLNSDGSVIVGKYDLSKNNELEGRIGWSPWSGNGTVNFVSCKGANILFTTSYAPNAITPVQLAELLDDTRYLDASQLYNTQPSGLPIPGGKGPLWYIAGGTVDLVDTGARPVNLSTVNAIGNMTANGGLAAAFNGIYVQTQAQGADKAAADGFVGLNYTARQIIGMALVWPSSDGGFAVGGSGNITLDLRADNSPPTLGSEGTLLATLSIADQTTGPVALAPSYNVTGYQYAWVRVRQTGATAVCIAQMFIATGPLWWLDGGSIQVGARMMGTYQVDANGFLVAQGVAGEDFTSATLTVGQPWTATLEPFIPPVQEGQDVSQRMWKRRINRAQVYVSESTGFVMQRLYADESGPNLPAAGTVMKTRRIETWNQDEDPTQPPPQREQSYIDRPTGRAHDPRWAVVKDTPGPLVVEETSFEITV